MNKAQFSIYLIPHLVPQWGLIKGAKGSNKLQHEGFSYTKRKSLISTIHCSYELTKSSTRIEKVTGATPLPQSTPTATSTLVPESTLWTSFNKADQNQETKAGTLTLYKTSVHPSIVIHWNTVNIASPKLSKFDIPSLGPSQPSLHT